LQEKSSNRPLLFFAFAVIFIDTVGYQIVIPALPFFARNYGLEDYDSGIIYASYGIASLLLYIPFGYLVDIFGRKRFIYTGLFLLSVSSFAFARADSFYELLVARVIQGVSASATWSGVLPLVAEVSGKQTMGVSMAGVGIAYSMGAIIGPAFGGVGELNTPFLLFSLYPLLLFFAFLFLKYGEDNMKDSSPTGFFEPLKSAGLIIASVPLFVSFFAIGAMEVLLPGHLASFHVSKQQIGLGFTLLGIFSALFQVLAGWWSDRRGRIEPIIAGMIVSALLLPLLSQAHTVLTTVLIFIPLAFAFASTLTPTLPLIADIIPAQNLGVAYGIYNTVFSIGIVGGPVVLTYIKQNYGLLPALCLLSLLMVFSSVVVYLLSTHRRT